MGSQGEKLCVPPEICLEEGRHTVNLQPGFFEPRSERLPPEVYFRINESAIYSGSVMEILAKRFRGSGKLQPEKGSFNEKLGRGIQRVSSILEGRRITSTGYGLAIVPASTLPGDVIYILGDSRIPVVLWDIPESPPPELETDIRNTLFRLENNNVTIRHVRLVGRCFVDNLPVDRITSRVVVEALSSAIVNIDDCSVFGRFSTFSPPEIRFVDQEYGIKIPSQNSSAASIVRSRLRD
ncbi:hypothetical protein BDZ45DRAFT_737070 [Acephala macrosclerotiorum]|nr:hypothetical protein BDZ45DRAFT_737070 [Acephala macrosclerotiorum]